MIQEIVLIFTFVFAVIWQFTGRIHDEFMRLTTTPVDDGFYIDGPLMMLPPANIEKVPAFPAELRSFLKEDYTLAEEASCTALQDPKILFHLKKNASKINASVLLFLHTCKLASFDDFLNDFTDWPGLKEKDLLFYYMLLVDLDFESLSSTSLASLPIEDLIANWPETIDQGYFCAKFRCKERVRDLISGVKQLEVKDIFKIIQWPCVDVLLRTDRESVLQFLLKWLPVHAQSDISCLLQWQLLIESLLMDQLMKIKVNHVDAELQYRRAHEIIKGLYGKVVQPIDCELRMALIDLYTDRHEKSFFGSIIARKPPRDEFVDPSNPPTEEDSLSFQFKRVFSAEVVFGHQSLHHTDFAVPHLPFYRLELAKSLFDVDLAVLLFTEQLVVSEITIVQWLRRAWNHDDGERIAKYFARNYESTFLNAISHCLLSVDELQRLLEQFCDLPKLISQVITRCEGHGHMKIELPFLPSNARLVSLTGSEQICLKAGTRESLPRSQKRALAKQFERLLKSAHEKTQLNDQINDFMRKAFDAIVKNYLDYGIRIDVKFLEHLGEDHGGLTRHFLEIVFGILGDEEFGCLMGAGGDVGNLMTFTPFLCPAWGGVLGFLHAQALVCNVAGPFLLSFAAQELEGLEGLPADMLPKLQSLLSRKEHCPPVSVFKLGRKCRNCISQPEATETYFKALRGIEETMREEANEMYWRCLMQTLGVNDSFEVRHSIQNVLRILVPTTPTGTDLMRVIHFSSANILLADGVPFEEAFESVILELSAERADFVNKFLRFVRGSSQIPTTGFDSLSISVEAREEEGTVLPLPTASTCAQTIKWSIIKGATVADLKAKLSLSVEYGEGYSFI